MSSGISSTLQSSIHLTTVRQNGSVENIGVLGQVVQAPPFPRGARLTAWRSAKLTSQHRSPSVYSSSPAVIKCKSEIGFTLSGLSLLNRY